MNAFQEAAIQQAQRSSFKNKMGAVMVHKGQIVGRGRNYAHSTGQQHNDGEHAEIAALNNTTARLRKGATIYVCRITSNGLMMARPCERCQKILRKCGVRYVWYSANNDWIRMRL